MTKDLVHQKYFWVLHGISCSLLQHRNPDYLLLKQVLYYLKNTWFHILFILLFLFFLLLFTFSFCFLLLMLFYQLFHLLLLQNPYYCLSVLSCQCCNFNWNTWNRQQRLGRAIITRARFEITRDSEQKAPVLPVPRSLAGGSHLQSPPAAQQHGSSSQGSAPRHTSISIPKLQPRPWSCSTGIRLD